MKKLLENPLPTPLKWFLILSLLVPCWVITFYYDVDLVVLYRVALATVNAPDTVYGGPVGSARFFYGPVSLVLIRWMAWFDYSTVRILWAFVQTAGFFIFWFTIPKLYSFLKSARPAWAWGFVFIFAINPIHNNFQSGNIQLLLVAALLLAEWWSRTPSRWKQGAAGILIFLSAAIKVFPGFIVVYALLCKPRAVILGMIIGGVLAIALPGALFGPTQTAHYFQSFLANLSSYHADNSLLSIPDILCFPSLLTRWYFMATGFDRLPSFMMTGILGMISLAFFWATWRARRQRKNAEGLWALAMALCVFLNSSSRVHYLIFYVPAFCVLLGIILDESKNRAVYFTVATVVLILFAFTVEGVVGKRVNDMLEAMSLPTYGMLLLCGSLAWKELTRRSDAGKNFG